MKITKAEFWKESNPLLRPYKIAYRVIDSVEIVFVRLETDQGMAGYGAATPAEFVTGESYEDCMIALGEHLESLTVGKEIECAPAVCRKILSTLSGTPAACAAVDIAVMDLFGKFLNRPLVKIFGQQHKAFPTSITIGIKPIKEALEEAFEYHARGFQILKLKVGKNLEKDIELTRKIDEKVGHSMKIRIDANQGYDPKSYRTFLNETRSLKLEFVEQPFPVDQDHRMLELDPDIIALTVGDESVQKPVDALNHGTDPKTFGIFNIKLMKCGGITAARQIAGISDLAGIHLMWGCMDESRVSIAAALHTALSSRQTRYVDLDGSFDLAQHLFDGGFILKDGMMTVTDQPGLGVTLK